jgi:hypothetical protein
MNARTFRRNVLIVIAFYAAVAVALVLVRQLNTKEHENAYNTLKDAIPLLIAIPAAWLGYCLQRRQSYLKDVRDLWSKLVPAVQDAIQYTHLPNPPQAEFAKLNRSLSIVIEELRAVFANVGEGQGNFGIFPFEKIKSIHSVVSKLGFGEGVTIESARAARAEVIGSWKLLRVHFLSELERGVPAKPDSPFLK